jgi:hypothetical protein
MKTDGLTARSGSSWTTPGARLALAVSGLTVVAFALRLSGLWQGLFGDETFTYALSRDGLSQVFHGIHRTENTPPLYYVLGWGVGQLGDLTSLLRVPSLVFGTATVPVVYAIGRRTVGAGAGLIGAGLVALSPFAIFYSDEARAYATMTFLVALSTLTLLLALERARVGWWIAYPVCACASLYTHYTAIFVVGAQAAWALWTHRDRLRTLVIVNLAIGLGYLPWLPSLLDQRGKELKVAIIGATSTLTPGTFFEYVGRALIGHPFVGLGTIPGAVGIALLGLGALVLVVAGLGGLARGDRVRRSVPPQVVLVWILALATPIGLAFYSLVGSTLYAPRNLSASMPALSLAIGGLLASLRPRSLSATATALVLAGLVVATVTSLEDRYRRPASRRVAHYIDQHAAPGDSVVSVIGSSLFFPPLDAYFGHRHPVYRVNVNDQPAWRRAAHGASVFLVLPQSGPFQHAPPLAGPGGRYILRERKVFPGLVKMTVGRYSGQARVRLTSRAGREVLTVRPGHDILVEPGAAGGTVDTIFLSSGQLAIKGWAGDVGRHRLADLVLAFSGNRLLAVNFFALSRPDVAKVFGSALERSGFVLATAAADPHALVARGRLHVIAVADGRASEVELSNHAKRDAATLSGG